MKRSTGVTVVAVLVILGSVFPLLMGLVALLMGMHVLPTAQKAIFPGPAMMFNAVLWLGFGGWGLATAVGLLRLNRWARVSILALSGLLAVTSAMVSLFVFIIPLPSPPNVPAALAVEVRLGIAAFHVFLAALGVWWLVYFTRSRIRAQFEATAPVGPPSPIPLGVRIVAWLLLFSALMMSFLMLSHFPATVLGILLTGWRASLYYLVSGVAQMGIGLGLLKQKPASHTLAVLFYVFAGLNGLAFSFLPDRAARIAAMISFLPEHMKVTGINVTRAAWLGSVVGLMFMGVALWLLMSGRKQFLAGRRPPAV